jgi:hypothetical protein
MGFGGQYSAVKHSIYWPGFALSVGIFALITVSGV